MLRLPLTSIIPFFDPDKTGMERSAMTKIASRERSETERPDSFSRYSATEPQSIRNSGISCNCSWTDSTFVCDCCSMRMTFPIRNAIRFAIVRLRILAPTGRNIYNRRCQPADSHAPLIDLFSNLWHCSKFGLFYQNLTPQTATFLPKFSRFLS